MPHEADAHVQRDRHRRQKDSSYTAHATVAHAALEHLSEEQLIANRVEVQKYLIDSGAQPDEHKRVGCVVSADGSWPVRGYTTTSRQGSLIFEDGDNFPPVVIAQACRGRICRKCDCTSCHRTSAQRTDGGSRRRWSRHTVSSRRRGGHVRDRGQRRERWTRMPRVTRSRVRKRRNCRRWWCVCCAWARTSPPTTTWSSTPVAIPPYASISPAAAPAHLFARFETNVTRQESSLPRRARKPQKRKTTPGCPGCLPWKCTRSRAS